MTQNEILDFLRGLDFTENDRKEQRIRELALHAAYEPSGSVKVAWMPPGALHAFYGLGEPSRHAVRIIDVVIELPPYARGFQRVLLAEKMIREQVG